MHTDIMYGYSTRSQLSTDIVMRDAAPHSATPTFGNGVNYGLQNAYPGPSLVREDELSFDLGIDGVGYLNPYIATPVERRFLQPPPLPPASAKHEIEAILGHAKAGTKQRNWTYLVKWSGFDHTHDTWVEIKTLAHAKELVDHYHRDHGLAKVRWIYVDRESLQKARRVKKIILRVNGGPRNKGT